MKTARWQKLLSLLCSLLILYWERVSLPMSWEGVGSGILVFNTENCNLFSAAACLLMAVFQAAALVTGNEVPPWVKLLKYMSVCCLMLTFLTVVFALAPIYGPGGYSVLLLTSSMLYHHFLNPAVAFLALVLFERSPRLPRRAVAWAMAPTLLYGAAALALNLARVIEGPYPFFRIYEQPVWCSCLWAAGLLGGSALINWTVWKASGGEKEGRRLAAFSRKSGAKSVSTQTRVPRV